MLSRKYYNRQHPLLYHDVEMAMNEPLELHTALDNTLLSKGLLRKFVAQARMVWLVRQIRGRRSGIHCVRYTSEWGCLYWSC